MSNDVLKIISDHLKIRFPIATISKDLGFSKGIVSEYYNGKKVISANFQQKFENFYNVKFSDFSQDFKTASSNLRERSINYINRVDSEINDMTLKMDKLVARMSESNDSNEMRVISSEMHQLFNELIASHNVQKEKVVEGFEKYSNVLDSINNNMRF